MPPRLVTRSAISSICSSTRSEILSNSSCRAMKFGPLTFQWACLTWLCKSMASANRSLSMRMTLRRVFSDRSILVLYIGRSFKISSSNQPGILHCLAANPKKERDVGGGVDSDVLGEPHVDSPAALQAARRTEGELHAGSEETHISAGNADALAVELCAHGPIRSEFSCRREPRKRRSTMRISGEQFIAERLRDSD